MPASPLPRKGDSCVHISSIIQITHGAAGGWHRNRHLLSYLQLSPVQRCYTVLGRSLPTRYASHTRGNAQRPERTCEAVGTHPDRRLAYSPRLSQVSPGAGASTAYGTRRPVTRLLMGCRPVASRTPRACHGLPRTRIADRSPRTFISIYGSREPSGLTVSSRSGGRHLGRSLPGACSPTARTPPDLRPRPSRASPPGCRAHRRAGSGNGRPLQPQARISPFKQNGVPEGTPFLIRIVRRSARCRKP